MKCVKKALALLLVPLMLTACAYDRQDDGYASPVQPANAVVNANYGAADALLAQLKGKLSSDKPLIMATIVNIDALEQTSTLGCQELPTQYQSARGERPLSARLPAFPRRHLPP